MPCLSRVTLELSRNPCLIPAFMPLHVLHVVNRPVFFFCGRLKVTAPATGLSFGASASTDLFAVGMFHM